MPSGRDCGFDIASPLWFVTMTEVVNVSPVMDRAYPELTWTAVVVGWILGVIIAISIGYAALESAANSPI